MFFVYFRREITEKGLERTKKVENGCKKVVQPAGRNTQQSSIALVVDSSYALKVQAIEMRSKHTLLPYIGNLKGRTFYYDRVMRKRPHS